MLRNYPPPLFLSSIRRYLTLKTLTYVIIFPHVYLIIIIIIYDWRDISSTVSINIKGKKEMLMKIFNIIIKGDNL